MRHVDLGLLKFRKFIIILNFSTKKNIILMAMNTIHMEK